MPSTTSVDQPPTSTTTSRPSTGPWSVPLTPANASLASSSPLSTRMGTPAASATAASSSAWLGASRTTAVPTTSIARTPRSRAI